MENPEFVERLRKTFGAAKMADVARRLNVPHATVQNYYSKGRIPASEVLMKIAKETSVSLNWLLLGTGDMYAVHRPPMGLGKFIEEKIAEMIDQKVGGLAKRIETSAGASEFDETFDIEEAVFRLDDPQAVMSEWFARQGREYPSDYGVVFFRGWETFSPEEKIDAVTDAKRMLDRALKQKH